MTNNDSKTDTEADAWLKMLAGDTDDNATEAELRSADTIRKIITAEQKLAEESIDDTRLAHGKDRLMFRLKKEQLFSNQHSVQPAWQTPWAMAASLAIVGLIALFTYTNIPVGPDYESSLLMSYGELEVMRGELPKPFVTRVDDPDSYTREFSARLETMEVAFELTLDHQNERNRLLRVQFDGAANQDELKQLLGEIGIHEISTSIIEILFISKTDDAGT